MKIFLTTLKDCKGQSAQVLLVLLLVMVGLLSCKEISSGENAPTLFELMGNTGISFANNIHNTEKFNIFNYRNFYNGGGAAIGDINNDGKADVFFTANMGSNKLYLNKGDWKFDDISQKAGITETEEWSTGVVMADVNNDNWLDIFVCNAGYINGQAPECKLFINNHDLTFTDSAAEYGLTNKGGYTTHAAFFDYDMDGDLDCFIINNSFIPVNTLNYANHRELRAKDWPVADFLKGGGDHLLRNDNGKFTDVSEHTGIHGSLISFGLGVTVGDVNGDHYPDVYVSNDFFERDYLYINQKNGTFKDELENRIQHTSLSSMGADMADINNDGLPDIFTTDMLPSNEYRLKTTTSFENYDIYHLKETSGFYHQFTKNTLQLNNGDGSFSEIANYSGVAATDWSWGGLIFDADNDGLSDLYVCNGINHDVTNQDFIDFFADDVIQKMVLTGKKEDIENVLTKMASAPIPNNAFKNEGNLKFSDADKRWGFEQPSFSNGAAYGDLDNDGDLDLIVNNVNEPAFVYKNNTNEQTKNHYISVLLKGKAKNTYAVGSTVKVFAGGNILTREVIPSRGFQSSVDYKNIIGLGTTNKIDSMIIVWPDLTYNTYYNPVIDTLHTIAESGDTKKIVATSDVSAIPVLKTSNNNFQKHTEDNYVDFYNERNVPVLLSREGPKAAYSDVNGDGLTDIYIGGASRQPGALYLQTSDGNFIQKKEKIFERFANYEDVAVLFFDADKDGDPDLFIGAGGNNRSPGRAELQHRLYKNDGKGNFDWDSTAFPSNNMNISVAIENDFDGDGDLDLFVGGRSMPLEYGISPQSYLFINDGRGNFKDVTKEKAPALATIGMITGAVWADVTGNKKPELIVTGEWMATHIFTYRQDHFEEIKSNLTNMYGMWQTIAAADLDGDGDIDFVLGNYGDNFYLHPDSANPAKIFINDFDLNNNPEEIITRTINGKDMPVFMKRDLQDQIPSIKKQNLKHEDYAKKAIQDIFKLEIMNKSVEKEWNYTSSCIALNNGNGNFTIRKLPAAVQFSSVNAVLCTDINNDGLTDIILGGNQLHFLPQFGRLDASFGHVLINNGKAQFQDLSTSKSGIKLDGEVRDILRIPGIANDHILFLRNDDFPFMYSISNQLHANTNQ